MTKEIEDAHKLDLEVDRINRMLFRFMFIASEDNTYNACINNNTFPEQNDVIVGQLIDGNRNHLSFECAICGEVLIANVNLPDPELYSKAMNHLNEEHPDLLE